jgi:hypothetical protein
LSNGCKNDVDESVEQSLKQENISPVMGMALKAEVFIERATILYSNLKKT